MQFRTIDPKIEYQFQSLLFNSWLKSLFTVQEFKEFEENELEEQITSAYLYDPFGRRIEKRVEEIEVDENDEDEDDKEKGDEDDEDEEVEITTERYLYDNEDILIIYDDKGRIISSFIHGPGIDEPLAITQKNKKKTKTFFYQFDGLGSVVGLTDKKGKIVQRFEYDSFGKLKQKGSKIKQPYAFTGREYDKETKLYYYRARYYDPDVGRFVSRDPFSQFTPQLLTLNHYSYVENNPITRIDPLGLWYIDINISRQVYKWIGLTGGIMINENGVYIYGGGGIISSPLSGSVTFSLQDPVAGWNVGIQGQYGIVAGQVGYAFGDGGGGFWEIGIGPPTKPSFSATAFYVITLSEKAEQGLAEMAPQKKFKKR